MLLVSHKQHSWGGGTCEHVHDDIFLLLVRRAARKKAGTPESPVQYMVDTYTVFSTQFYPIRCPSLAI